MEELPDTLPKLLALYTVQQIMTYCGGMRLRWDGKIYENEDWRIAKIKDVDRVENYKTTIPVKYSNNTNQIYFHTNSEIKFHREDILAIVTKLNQPIVKSSRFDSIESD